MSSPSLFAAVQGKGYANHGSALLRAKIAGLPGEIGGTKAPL
jgi:hypothetical protein